MFLYLIFNFQFLFSKIWLIKFWDSFFVIETIIIWVESFFLDFAFFRRIIRLAGQILNCVGGLLHWMVVVHWVWDNCNSKRVQINLSIAFSSHHFDVTTFSPIFTPGVFDNPFGASVNRCLISNNLDNMVSVKLEGLLCSVIRSFFVGQEICEWLHLSNHWAVFD